jgi:hypothetical protein
MRHILVSWLHTTNQKFQDLIGASFKNRVVAVYTFTTVTFLIRSAYYYFNNQDWLSAAFLLFCKVYIFSSISLIVYYFFVVKGFNVKLKKIINNYIDLERVNVNRERRKAYGKIFAEKLKEKKLDGASASLVFFITFGLIFPIFSSGFFSFKVLILIFVFYI